PFKYLFAEDIYIGVASNFLKPMKALKENFESINNGQIFISSGSSGSLYSQIIKGAPLDIFLSADQGLPQKLEKTSKAILGTRFTYATGQLVLYSTKQFLFSQSFPQFLTSNKINYIGIGKPGYVPYGRAAKEVLKSLNIFKEISSKLVFNKSVNQVFLMNYFGNLDIGFISKADFLSNNKKGKIWEIPKKLYSPIKQDAILLKNGEQKNNAILFLKYLSSERTKKNLKKFGYVFD
ncbi:molybdate ABC transporter substrate-binding protein, partial [Alphaproteobacteria bacterium]|nr:molybdate ABC transporter substrate-binding protein [Alphaproteobacteria bacterium]